MYICTTFKAVTMVLIPLWQVFKFMAQAFVLWLLIARYNICDCPGHSKNELGSLSSWLNMHMDHNHRELCFDVDNLKT